MTVTRVAYSKDVHAGKYAQLMEQARRLGVVRSLVWDRYGSITGVGVSDRQVRDAWMRDGTATRFGVLANAWKETVRDAVADIRSNREAAKAAVRCSIARRDLSDADRKALYVLLKSDRWTGHPLLRRLMRKAWRRGHNHTANQIIVRSDNVRTFTLTEGGTVWLKVPGLRPRTHVAVPLNRLWVWRANDPDRYSTMSKEKEADTMNTTGRMGPDAVVAVVVTRHRRELLADSLKLIAAQTKVPDHLIVVDNGPDEPADEVVAACSVPSTYLLSQRNLGGAGGFALGMLHALALGAEWVWLADDDGRPADETVLATLLAEAQRRKLAAVSPVVANIDTPNRLAFPLRRGLTWKRSADQLGTDFLPGIASLFNGALFRASTLDVIGVPDYRLFFRGDEVEVHRRLVRSGLPFGTCLRVSYLHPDGSAEFKPMLGGRFHAQDPEDPTKRYYTYRNRGYLLSQPGMRKIGALEVLRFGLYFLGVRRDPKAFLNWLRLVRQGQRERFFRK